MRLCRIRVQASEKYWGATAQLLKLIAEENGWPHHRHRDLQLIINRLYEKTEDRDLLVLFDVAQALHANFYEDFLKGKLFQIHVDSVKQLIDKLQKLNGKKYTERGHNLSFWRATRRRGRKPGRDGARPSRAKFG